LLLRQVGLGGIGGAPPSPCGRSCRVYPVRHPRSCESRSNSSIAWDSASFR
jgi:hypothetical protein